MERDEQAKLIMSNRFRKGIFLLPSLITTFSFFCGFYALIAVFNGRFYFAAIAIIIAAMFDFLDGRVARATGSTSKFGMHYDSLTDLMSFGIAPGFLVYSWVLQPYGRLGWMAAFLYVICGALRLARFNSAQEKGVADSQYFVGLPIPAAAGFIASMVIFSKDFLLMEKLHPMILLFTVYMLAFLMVSNIRYISFKTLELKKRKPFNILIFMILTIYIVAFMPELMLFILAVSYAFSGPLMWPYYRRLGKKEKALKTERHPRTG